MQANIITDNLIEKKNHYNSLLIRQVKGVVYDNHPSNVSAYRKLLAENMEPHNQLSITVEESGNIYLFYDTVHLVRNVRSNLRVRKRFIFSSFSFKGFSKDIYVPGGEISWKLLHDTHEKDKSCISTLRKASMLTKQVSHIFMKLLLLFEDFLKIFYEK